jgi:hypothetical protein
MDENLGQWGDSLLRQFRQEFDDILGMSFSLWGSQPGGLPNRESNFNSPAPSYVLDSNSGSHSAHSQLNYALEKLKPSMSMQPSMAGQYSPCVSEDLDDDPNSAEPYAKLIHRALMSAPSYSMALKEIYVWFGKNMNKATDSSSTGWQNSIRYNLSMNPVRSI